MKIRKIKAAVLLAGLICVPQLLSAKKHTNFIVILMDDMGYGDIPFNGAIGYNMPNMNKMVASGMLMSHFYAPQAISGASRAGLLTGCYPNRIGMSGAPFPGAKHGIHQAELTIAEVLRPKGYTCAAYGKWHLGDAVQFLPLKNGFDEYYGIPYSHDMWPGTTWYPFPDLPLIEGEKVVETNPDPSRFTTEFTNRAVDFIDRNKKRPFFLYLAHPMPHVPLAVSDKFKGKSGVGMYGDVMMELDWSVGEILKKLKQEKLEENTLVIVLSDNGPWINYGNHSGSTSGLREGKATSFEGGQRVPCVIQWKGVVPAGSVCHNLASGIDLLTTFADISEAPLPEHKIDGVSLLPLLKGIPGANPRSEFYYYYKENDLEAVTDGHFKLIFPHTYRTYEGFLPGKDGAPGKYGTNRLEESCLIDLRQDPGEGVNVIHLYPEVVDRLDKIAERAREDLGDNLTKRKGMNRRPSGSI